MKIDSLNIKPRRKQVNAVAGSWYNYGMIRYRKEKKERRNIREKRKKMKELEKEKKKYKN